MRYYLKIDLSDLELENMGAIQNYIQTQIDMQRLRAPMNREEKGSLMAFLSAQFSINFSIYFNIFFGIINPFEFMTKEFDLYKIINLSRDQVTTNSFGNATMIIKSLCNEVFLDGVYQYSYIKNTLGIYPGKLLFISIYNPDTLPPGFLNKTRNSVFEFSNEVSNTLLPLCFFFCVLFSVILGGAFYRFIRNADNTFVRANRTLIACFISSLVFIGQSFTPFLSYASSIPFSAMMACGTTYRTAKGTSLLYGLTDYTEDAMSLLSIGSISFLSVISLGIAIRKALSLRRASAHLNPAAVASLVGQGQSTTTGNDSPIARSFSV